MGAYGYGIIRYGMGAQAGTMAFMSLTFGQILHALSCRSEKHRIYDKEKLPPNRYLDAALAGSAAFQGLAMVVPGLRNLLGLAPIGLAGWLVVGGTSVAPLLINEATKKSRRERLKAFAGDKNGNGMSIQNPEKVTMQLRVV
jgi:Ca2+-transporting ATPase